MVVKATSVNDLSLWCSTPKQDLLDGQATINHKKAFD